MSKKIKVGLIGSGFIGQVAHINSLQNQKDVEIVALSELRPKLGQKVCKKYNIKKLYQNFEEMIDENKLDLIIAIVRRYHTAEVAFKVLSRGVNLFTEKPMAPSYSQAKKLLDLSKKKKLKYIIGNMRRFDEGIQFVKNILSNKNKLKKQFGELINFKSHCYAGYDYCNIDGDIRTDEPPPTKTSWPKYPNWIKNKRLGNEFEKFLNYFSHDINLIRYFFGDKFKTKAFFKKNSGNIFFNFENFYGTFDFIYASEKIWREKFEINFSRGRIIVELPPAFLRNQPSKIKIFYDKGLNKIYEPKFDWTWSFKNQSLELIKSIKNKKKSVSSADDTLKDLDAIENIWKNSNLI